LTVNGSIAAGSTVNVGNAGTLAGTGTVFGMTTVTNNGVINFGVGGNIVGTLTTSVTSGTGASWNGVGSVGGAVTVNSGTFNLGSNATLTAAGGLNVTGGSMLSSTDSTSTISGSINYTSSQTSTFAGNVVGSGSMTVNASGASFAYPNLGFNVVGGGLILSGNGLYTGTTTVSNGTLTVNNGLSGTGGTVNIGALAVLQGGGLVSRTVTTPGSGAGASGVIQAVAPLVLANFSGPFNFYGLIDVQSTSVEVATGMPVRSQLSFINLNNGGYLTSGSGIVMPNATGAQDGVPGDSSQGMITISGTATIGGYIQFGLVHGDSVNIYGLTGTDGLVFTGTVHGNLSAPGVNIDLSQAVNLLGFSPSFNAFTGFTFSTSSNALFVGTNVPYLPTATVNSLTPAVISGTPASTSNYSQYLAYGYTQLTGGTHSASGVITIPAGAPLSYTPSNGLSSYFSTESLYFVRTDGHMWANTTRSGLTGISSTQNGTYQFNDGTIAGFANVTLGSFGASLPTLPSGLSWQVESTSAYVRLYVQGFLPMGSGTWQNGSGDSNWSTNTSASNNWSTGQPSSVGQIATFGALSAAGYAGGVVHVDSAQTIGGLALSDSGQGGYTISGSTLTLTNANIVSGVVSYTDPIITVSSGTHVISSPLIIGNGGTSQTNGLVVAVASSSQLTLSGVISSGFNTGNNLTLNGAGTLNLNGVNTYTGNTAVNGGTLGGLGTVPGATLVGAAGKLRGGMSDGTNNWGTLTIGGGASVVSSGGTLLTEVSRTAANTANASLIKLSGGTFNLPSSFNLSMLNNGLNDVALVNGETYTIALVQVATSGGVLLGGTSQGASAVIPAGDYNLSSPTLTFNSVTLAIDGTGTKLQLTFTPGPVPEPEHIMLLCVGVLLVGLAVRRRWRRDVSAVSVA
jgi:fibronectin-binding autotransporter adhesin